MVEFAPVAFLTILVAIAGPVGITLGWWLGKRSERERTAREERKSAFVAFTTAGVADMGHSWAAWFVDPSGNVLAVVQPKG